MLDYQILVWIALGVLGYFTAHAVLERKLYHLTHRLAAPIALQQVVRSIRESGSPYSKNGARPSVGRLFWSPSLAGLLQGIRSRRNTLGWLGQLPRDGWADREKLAGYCYQRLSEAERFMPFLGTMVNVGGYLGLLGTVLAFVELTNLNQDFASLMPFAFQTTLAGLMISIPASLSHGLLGPRADRLADQIVAVIDALETVPDRTKDAPTDTLSASVSIELLERLVALQERQIEQINALSIHHVPVGATPKNRIHHDPSGAVHSGPANGNGRAARPGRNGSQRQGENGDDHHTT